MTTQIHPLQTATNPPVVYSDQTPELTDAAESRASFWKYPAGSDCSVALVTSGNKPVTATRRAGTWSYRG